MDAFIAKLGAWFTITKIIVGIAGAAVTAWGVSWFVADYVSKANLGGLTVAVSNLQASIDTLNGTVQSVNSDLSADIRELNNGRATLAQDIAERVATVQAAQQNNDQVIAQIRQSVARIEDRLGQMQATSNISYDEATKNFKVEGLEAVFKAYNLSKDQPVFIGPIAPQ